MKVSIIIPIYKVEDEIERCLKSVIEQTYNDIELVLVNDKSPDSSFDIAKKLLHETSHLNLEIHYYEHEKNMGVSVARNTGINNATGDYLFFLDSDDELSSKDSIRILVGALEKNRRLDLVVGGFNYINSSNEIVPNNPQYQFFERNSEIFPFYVKHGILITPWAKLIRRMFLLENNLLFEEGIYHEDFLWSFQSYRVAENIKILSDTVYNYHNRDNSITSTIRNKNVVDLVTVAEKIYSIHQESPEYYPKETLVILETTKRTAFRYLSLFNDKKFILGELLRLKKMRLPLLAIKKTSLLKFNILMRFPNVFIFFYLRLKKQKIRSFGEK